MDRNRGLLITGVVLIVVPIALYGHTVFYDFFRDDYYLLRPLSEWSFWDSFSNWRLDRQATGYWRPLWTLWLSSIYSVVGLAPGWFHAASVALATAALLLTYLALRTLGHCMGLSLTVSLVWFVLAGNSYPVSWISGSCDLIALVFAVLGGAIWLHAVQGARLGAVVAGLSGPAWLLSVLAKEVAFYFPWIAIPATWALTRFQRMGGRDGAARALVIGLVVALVVFVALRVFAGVGVLIPSATSMSPVASGTWATIALSHAIHYGEGLVYPLFPADLARSWPELALAAALFVAFIYCVAPGVAEAFRRHPGRCSLALCWTALMSLHAGFNPHPRTLMVPALGEAYLAVLGSRYSPRRIGVLISGGLLIAVHLYWGQSVVSRFGPSSPQSLSAAAKVLNGNPAPVSPAMRAHIAHQLVGRDIDAYLRMPMAEEEPTLWRSMLKRAWEQRSGPR